MQKVYSLIGSLADVETTVLITGESGTGKELAAEALHFMGGRRDRPLVKVNCSTLSENLLESELFGHVKGAFTGAVSDRSDGFRSRQGSIFSSNRRYLSSAVSLLGCCKRIQRVGDSKPVKVDVGSSPPRTGPSGKVKRGGSGGPHYRLKVVGCPFRAQGQKRQPSGGTLSELSRKFLKSLCPLMWKIFHELSWPDNVRVEACLEHVYPLPPHTITADLFLFMTP
jgi:hypothetical protein